DVLRDLESDGELFCWGELIMSFLILLYQLMLSSIDDERQFIVVLAEWMGEPAGSTRPALIVSAAGAACRVAMELHKAAPGRPVLELVREGFQLLAQGIDPAFGLDN